MICADPELLQLGEDFFKAYKKALEKSPDPEKLQEEIRSWFAHWKNKCESYGDCLSYQSELETARLHQRVNNPFHKFEDTTFRYDLEESYDDQVCRHMLEVFNNNFSTLWKHEEPWFLTGERSPETGYGILKSNPSYEEHGKYAFPKLPGVKHDVALTAEMAQQKLPTSPEFDLIPWREGRMKVDEFTESILAADFDIDNDGQIETVLKTGLNCGNIYHVSHHNEESYYVYHQGEINPSKVEDYSTLGKKAIYSLYGHFFRPFIFKGKTYFTEYVHDWGIFGDTLTREIPESEAMLIERYTKASGSDKPQAESICRYRMTAVQTIENSNKKEKEGNKLTELETYPKGSMATLKISQLSGAEAASSPKTEAALPKAGDLYIDLATNMEFVYVPGSCFQMGSPASETDRDADEGPVHEVCVDGMYLGRYEVTVGEWRIFIKATGYKTDAEKDDKGCYVLKDNKWDDQKGYYWDNVGFPQTDRQPVACVSYNDTVQFANWLKEESSKTYRLPTEAEWEYAARGGTTAMRYWGNDETEACRYANVADKNSGFDKSFTCNDGYKWSSPVGSFKANTFGLFDMLGNVGEWVGDWYDQEFYYRNTPRNNPVGPLGGCCHVLRGGGWEDGPRSVRSASRGVYLPNYRNNALGFRLLLQASAPGR